MTLAAALPEGPRNYEGFLAPTPPPASARAGYVCGWATGRSRTRFCSSGWSTTPARPGPWARRRRRGGAPATTQAAQRLGSGVTDGPNFGQNHHRLRLIDSTKIESDDAFRYGRVFQSTAFKGRRVGSQPPFLFPHGVLGLVAATVPGGRTTAWTTTPRDTAADELAKQCRWMEVSTTGAAQR